MDSPVNNESIVEKHTPERTKEYAPNRDLSASIMELLQSTELLPIGTPLTYGATPLDRVKTLQQQLDLAERLRELTLTNVPEGIPATIVNYMQPTFSQRFHSRGEANEENYLSALLRKEDYAEYPEVVAMIERGEYGLASPSELLATRSLLGIRSIELGCVSHPYGNRIASIYDMRSAIKDHVEALGGIYDTNPEARYRVKSIICPNHENTLFKAVGFLMTKKTTLGMMEDGTIIRERASFVLRTDIPEVQSRLHTMFPIVRSPGNDWQDALVEAGNLSSVVDALKDNDEFTKLIPISSTIYAFNPETAQEVMKRKEVAMEERRLAHEAMLPELSQHLRELYGDDWFIEPAPDATKKMFYDGPPLNSTYSN